ncbi:PEPxxWA-CTERM sorting domain-containing protein [Sphingomonas echinoides]|uniref:PEPxxWA-CTERM sorting domain-containing protein n=1 Tax=Sphingomonas echinoides TaxID=59803 RepID=UPI002412FF6E|nr:PEPxxWA-CTERM sorting domain-containing protein [Sphingomonas echinoides]
MQGFLIMQFKSLFRSGYRLAAVAALAVGATQASADVQTFATFSSISPTKNIRLVNSGTGASRTSDFDIYTTSTATSTSVGATQVNFSFLQKGLSAVISNAVANFTLSAAATANEQAIAAGSTLVQPTISGFMTFTSTQAITLTSPFFATKTFAAGANLLTVTFDGAMSGTKNGSNVNMGGSTEGGNNIVFTSDFLDFSNVNNSDLTTSFSALTAGLGIDTNKSLKSFRATAGGQFSSDPAPLVLNVVPEPVTWVMMVTGFAMLGLAIRRQPRAARLTA